ncbi:hypothetical protein TeGR_g6905 [Tetraparma gracilis]|uniref:ATP-dependent DNA helicase n=1 Tax=Tetraparma gracilis TaxID=2962635 RepID=A0ABQ6MZ80_9STRA|nr:hypothetical protein TeGR_g6905 [Tetraparma gracilis]
MSRYETMKVGALKQLLKDRSLKQTGRKRELIARLYEFDDKNWAKPKPKPPEQEDEVQLERQLSASDSLNAKFQDAARAGSVIAVDDALASDGDSDGDSDIEVLAAAPPGYLLKQQKKRKAGEALAKENEPANLQEKGRADPQRDEALAALGLNPQQEAAAELILRPGSNVFLTGVAGTGKSFVIDSAKTVLRERLGGMFERAVCTVAPTGIAADNVGGTTLHSFAGWFHSPGKNYDPAGERIGKAVNARIAQCDVLFVDEISMVDTFMFDALDSLAKFIRKSTRPFGGIKLVLSGDFFQLPPVSGTHCVFSPCWSAAALQTVELTTVVRQANDPDFVQLLRKARLGRATDEEIGRVLGGCLMRNKPLPNVDEIQPSMLYCTNRDVDSENASRLAQLPGDEVLYRAEDQYKIVVDYKGDGRLKISEQMNPRASEFLRLKLLAQVILTMNMPELSLVNGSRGIVVGFQRETVHPNSSTVPVVKFDNGLELVMEKKPFTKRLSNGNELSRKQFPLRLAWALTIHKSQGQTISKCIVDVANVFSSGQGYVALSRVSNSEGLWIKNSISSRNCFANDAIGKFFGHEVNTFPKPGAVTSTTTSSSSSSSFTSAYSYSNPPSTPPRPPALRPPAAPLTPEQRKRIDENKERARLKREAIAKAKAVAQAEAEAEGGGGWGDGGGTKPAQTPEVIEID